MAHLPLTEPHPPALNLAAELREDLAAREVEVSTLSTLLEHLDPLDPPGVPGGQFARVATLQQCRCLQLGRFEA